MLDLLLNRPVSIVTHVAAEDPDDFSEPDGVGVTVETTGALDQDSATEGELAQSHWKLYLRADETIDATSSVVVDGDEYQVLGEPYRVEDKLTGRIDHLEVSLERAGGIAGGS